MLRELKQSLRRDLENLLNTRRRCQGWPDDLDEWNVSLVNYGIPDIAGADLGSAENREEFRRAVDETIRRFEPRFQSVYVRDAATTPIRWTGRCGSASTPCCAPSRPRSRWSSIRRCSRRPATSKCKGAEPMSDELLPYYNRELAFIRRLGAEFAEAHPKIAGRLRLGPDAAEDPHVERLIEAFAYLNARIRHKLDDDFPEITDALLGVLYPALSGADSVDGRRAIRARPRARRTGRRLHGRPRSPLETETIDGEPCRFRTCYPVTLWPIELTAAGSDRAAASPRRGPGALAAAAVLRLELECFGKELTFGRRTWARCGSSSRGRRSTSFALYELMLNNTLGVALAASPDGSASPSGSTARCMPAAGRLRARRGHAPLLEPRRFWATAC